MNRENGPCLAGFHGKGRRIFHRPAGAAARQVAGDHGKRHRFFRFSRFALQGRADSDDPPAIRDESRDNPRQVLDILRFMPRRSFAKNLVCPYERKGSISAAFRCLCFVPRFRETS
ncbi:hypothetical protein Pden_2625 [Paracoccus denitrificans PD1222]|uniref:Uncharacterized protein n=1 Tax=Paracoccus denitrificans (strain Pd 1222) TaxID=318586 RepID=A1B5B8_PARDP|nr:hypothetical protein Pden_2625 [Paracoccus denitrificans PD1222]